MSAQRRFRSACAFAQSDQNLPWAKSGQTKIQSLFMLTTKTDQTARMRRLIRVFVGRICEKVRFLTFRFICCATLENNFYSYMQAMTAPITLQSDQIFLSLLTGSVSPECINKNGEGLNCNARKLKLSRTCTSCKPIWRLGLLITLRVICFNFGLFIDFPPNSLIIEGPDPIHVYNKIKIKPSTLIYFLFQSLFPRLDWYITHHMDSIFQHLDVRSAYHWTDSNQRNC